MSDSMKMVKLALGTVQFGLDYGVSNADGQVAHSEASAIVGVLSREGVDTIDTAISYGDSEQRLGRIGMKSFRVISKLPEIPENTGDVRGWVNAQVRDSLARLKVDSLYGLLLHRPGQLLEVGVGTDLHEALVALKESGIISKWGVSIYDPIELNSLPASMVFDLVQAPFNVVDRRLKQSGWLDRLSEKGVEVHTRSAFLQGLLLMNERQRPAYFQSWEPIFTKWHSFLTKSGLSSVEACLLFCFQHPGISRVVVGINSVEQAYQIQSALTKATLSLEFPETLASTDVSLLNPSLWKTA